MPSLFRTGPLRRAALALALLLPGAAFSQTPPASAFFQDPAFANARIAPDGRHVAMTDGAAGARRGLVMVDLDTMTPKVLVRFPNADVGAVFWLNDKRLAFHVINIKPGDTDSTGGTYAIDADGSHLTGLEKLVDTGRRFDTMDCFSCGERTMGTLVHHSPELTDNFFTLIEFGGQRGIAKVHSRTRIIDEVEMPDWSFAWIVDDEERVRVTLSSWDGKLVLNYRERQGDWRKVTQFDPASPDAFLPVFFAGKTLYVRSRKGGNDSAIYRYDLERARIADEPLISAPGFDVEVQWLWDGKKLIGVHVATDAQRTVWFDAGMKQVQEEVDALLPNTINRIQRPHRGQTPYLLIDAYSPAHPDAWYVFNGVTKKLTRLGAAFADIDPARMGIMAFQRYSARDGLPIPAYVTLPRTASKNLPAVVLAGDAPGHRNGFWNWQPQVQFLASRGYAVIQPQVRGTAGFGKAHMAAVDKPGKASAQSDLADAAAWAIAQGIADPARICIIGSGAGGLAALTALGQDAALFHCGAGIAAFGAMPAATVKRPLLLAYGAQDQISAVQGRQLADAIRAGGNPDVEFHLYDEQGRAPSAASNRIDLWTRIEQFLARQIGQAPAR